MKKGKGHAIVFLAAVVVFFGCGSYAAKKKAGDPLGIGLVHIECDYDFDPVKLYKDSACRQVLTIMTPDSTTCPECMNCAEYERHYHGSIHPFICGSGNGLNFICTAVYAAGFEIEIDASGRNAYLPKEAGKFYDWNSYYQWQAGRGEYFVFSRQWDSTVLYDKQYDQSALPAATDSLLQAGTHFKDIDDLHFHPVVINGYWMKLIATYDKDTAGYCWIIWRNKDSVLCGFHFRTD
ncbi:hypothetical protein ACTHGU_00240 [Chitinophagaceae bacterium MMS25-I14]